METLHALLALFFTGHWWILLMLTKTNDLMNRRIASDLRRSEAHCDISVMLAPLHPYNPYSTRETALNDMENVPHVNTTEV